jgi:hypothetical protein
MCVILLGEKLTRKAFVTHMTIRGLVYLEDLEN